MDALVRQVHVAVFESMKDANARIRVDQYVALGVVREADREALASDDGFADLLAAEGSLHLAMSQSASERFAELLPEVSGSSDGDILAVLRERTPEIMVEVTRPMVAHGRAVARYVREWAAARDADAC